MTLCLFYGASQSRKISRNVFLAWLMMAIGQLCFTLGDGLWALMETFKIKRCSAQLQIYRGS